MFVCIALLGRDYRHVTNSRYRFFVVVFEMCILRMKKRIGKIKRGCGGFHVHDVFMVLLV